MPILIPRTVTPHPFKHLAKSPLRCLPTQARHLHEIVAADSIRGQATLEQDVNEYAPPLRARRHGFKSLPVSPLLREENAKKPRKRNAQQHDALKDLQKEVATNPYAQALATPIRTCTLTLARLPSHFLLPFTTTIERPPPTANSQTPKPKAHLLPGHRADFEDEETLAQTSYVLNRLDLVRHLSRRKHWTNLITDRQKEKFAGVAHRSPSAHKLVQDHWVWQDQVDATTAMLERKAVMAVKCAVEAGGQDTRSTPSATGEHAFGLVFNNTEGGDAAIEAQAETGFKSYKLPTLLSNESLDNLRRELAQNSTSMVYISKTPEACQAQLAIDRLKAYKEFNEVHKELPQVQNAPGTREARLRRQALESNSGALPDGENELDDAM